MEAFQERVGVVRSRASALILWRVRSVPARQDVRCSLPCFGCFLW